MKCAHHKVIGCGACFPQDSDGDAAFVVARIVEKDGAARTISPFAWYTSIFSPSTCCNGPAMPWEWK